MFRSRKRSREFRFTEADMRMRAALGDANIIAWYDARFPHTITLDTGVSGWADSRPVSPGPSLAQATDAAQPAYDGAARTVTFDGTADYLRVASAAWNTITAACGVAVVGTLPTTGGADLDRVVELSEAGAAAVLAIRRSASNGNMRAAGGTGDITAQVASVAGTITMHGRREAASGGNTTFGARIGSAAEGTSSGAQADQTASRLTVGASRFDVATAFADCVVRAVLVIDGQYTTAMQAAVTAWARATHGAA